MNRNEYSKKRIAVVGIGGVGGYIAGMLTRVSDQVTLCARGERGRSIRENGLVLHSDFNGESTTHPLRVVDSADQLGEQDIILVCVKNYSLEEVGHLLNKVVKEDTIVMPIMNGVDPGDTLRRCLNQGRVIDSLIYIVSFANADYSITQQGDFADVIFGVMNADEKEQAAVAEVAEIMRLAGITYKVSDDVVAEIWKKYIFNCAYNVLTAAYDNNVGQLRSDEKKVQEIRDLIHEAYLVAVAKGVHVNEADEKALVNRFLYEVADDGTSSLQRDINAKKTAETETFGGYVVKEAEKLGIDAPVSQRMYDILKNL